MLKYLIEVEEVFRYEYLVPQRLRNCPKTLWFDWLGPIYSDGCHLLQLNGGNQMASDNVINFPVDALKFESLALELSKQIQMGNNDERTLQVTLFLIDIALSELKTIVERIIPGDEASAISLALQHQFAASRIRLVSLLKGASEQDG